MTDFVRKAINFGHRNGLNVVELALAFSTGRRCNHEQYIELCTYFKDEKIVLTTIKIPLKDNGGK